MKSSSLSDIKGLCDITCNGDYIVILGKKLWVFKRDGTFVVCRADISNAFKVAFLPGNYLLTGSERKASYRLLSLENGADMWTDPPVKHSSTSRRFAISPDNTTAYDFYWWRGIDYIVKIDLQTGQMDSVPLDLGLRATMDIMCDEDGTPCLLQTHDEMVAGERVSQNGIRIQDLDGTSPGCAYYWKNKWQSHWKAKAKYFLDGMEFILTDDLHVLEHKTGKLYDLLENDPNREEMRQIPSDCWLDQSKRYISLLYETANVIVDWHARKVVARYASTFTRGCLIDQEYWVCTDEGIQRKPFPAFEEIPPQKYVFWKL